MAVAAASSTALWGLLQCDDATDVGYFVGEDDEWLTLQRLDAICRWLGLDLADVLPRIHIAEAVPRFGYDADLDIVRRQFDMHPDIGFTVIEPLYLASPKAEGSALYDMGSLLGAIQQVVVNEAHSGLLIGHHWNLTGKGSGPERLAGAGVAEWARVIFSGRADNPAVTPDFFSRRKMLYNVTGTRIAGRTIEVVRELRRRTLAIPAVRTSTVLRRSSSANTAPPSALLSVPCWPSWTWTMHDSPPRFTGV